MIEELLKILTSFLKGSGDQAVLIILILMIALFSFITLGLFFITIYLRIYNTWKNAWEKRMQVKWGRVFLELIDAKINAREAFRSLRWTNTISYLLFLEKYIDMIKGKEQEQLIILGRLSSKKLHSLINSTKKKHILYGIHLTAIFHIEEQIDNINFNMKDVETSLVAIREMATISNYKVKEKLIKHLFSFSFVSPVYISNIIAEMGNTVIPILILIIKHRTNKPFEHVVALESLKRLRYYEFFDLAEFVLSTSQYPSVVASCLGYIEKLGNEKYLDLLEPFFSYPNNTVRAAAVRAYIATAPLLNSEYIIKFFDDESVQVAVSAADKLKDKKILPHIPIKTVDYLKWGIIYKRMVF